MKCIGCNISKQTNDFYRNSQGRAGFRTRCKPCLNEQKNENRRKRLATLKGRLIQREYERGRQRDQRAYLRSYHLVHYWANLEASRAAGREKSRRYYRRNHDVVVDRARQWRLDHPAIAARWKKENQLRVKRYDLDRRIRKAGVGLVIQQSVVCGVPTCLRELMPDTIWPHPMSTTVGHEPPLSRTKPGDTVIERPEHWRCNQQKGTRLDSELQP